MNMTLQVCTFLVAYGLNFNTWPFSPTTPATAVRGAMAVFTLETDYPSETGYPLDNTDNTLLLKFWMNNPS